MEEYSSLIYTLEAICYDSDVLLRNLATPIEDAEYARFSRKRIIGREQYAIKGFLSFLWKLAIPGGRPGNYQSSNRAVSLVSYYRRFLVWQKRISRTKAPVKISF